MSTYTETIRTKLSNVLPICGDRGRHSITRQQCRLGGCITKSLFHAINKRCSSWECLRIDLGSDYWLLESTYNSIKHWSPSAHHYPLYPFPLYPLPFPSIHAASPSTSPSTTTSVSAPALILLAQQASSVQSHVQSGMAHRTYIWNRVAQSPAS